LKNFKFIDTHIHGCFGINFNYATYDEIKFLLKKLYEKNIKGICPTLVGETKDKLNKQLAIFKKIKEEQLKTIKEETLILGVHLEGTFLNPQKSGIQNPKVFKKPTMQNFKKLFKDNEDIIKIVTLAPELDKDLINYLLDKKIKPQAGHTIGETLKKCTGTTHHFCAMKSIHHREKSICLKGLIDDEIYCEIIADMVHTSLDTLKLFFKLKPKEKVLLVSDCLPSSNYNNELTFCSKKINKFGKDENGTLAGSIKTLDEICINLIKEKIITNKDIEKMAFDNQIKYLGLSQKEIDILNK